jgi:DNA-binding MarR family transcriptional regulator
MTMTELSRFLMVSNGNVTGIIDRLVAEKMVSRASPAGDRRAIVVKLTRKGAALFAAMAKTHESWVDGFLSGFGVAEAAGMSRRLDELTARVRNGKAKRP